MHIQLLRTSQQLTEALVAEWRSYGLQLRGVYSGLQVHELYWNGVIWWLGQVEAGGGLPPRPEAALYRNVQLSNWPYES